MGNDLNTTNNKFLQGVYENLIKDDEYKNFITQDIAVQKTKLKEIFTQIADNDVSSGERAHLEQAVEKLSDEIAKIEEQMKSIEKQISEKEKDIQTKVEEITEIATKTDKESKLMEQEHIQYVQNCIASVLYDYSRGTVRRDEVSSEIQRRIGNDSTLANHQNNISRYMSNLDSEKVKVKALSDEVTGIVDKVSLLKQQFVSLNSAKSLIDKTLGQIGNSGTSYTNSDYNSATPTYSLDKTAIVSNLFTNEKYNVPSTNTAFEEGSEPAKSGMSIDELKEKYGGDGKGYFGVSSSESSAESASDSVSDSVSNSIRQAAGGRTVDFSAISSRFNGRASNLTQLQKLGKALNDKEFINDLLDSQLSNNEILEFFEENFPDTKIKLNDDGSFAIPYGSTTTNDATYTKLESFINNDLSKRETYTKNTWDKDKGNTIDSNEQLKALGENYKDIFKTLAKGEPPFSFKEAMYALFDSKNGLFKNSGINYDLTEQGSNPKYSIDKAGDKETAELYSNISKSIEEYWGVSFNTQGEKIPTKRTGTPPQTENTDPFTFRDKDGAECAFIIDRNNDDSISDMEEFVGAKKGTTWLDDLKSLDLDGDGKLAGDELKGLKILKSQYKDNAETKMADDKYLRETTTDIDYTVTDALALGIEEIDLSNLEDKVGKSTGEKDINGSELFEDSFTFKMNGEEITATRKDDTDEFMKTVYNDAIGKAHHLGFEESVVDEVVDESSQKFNSEFMTGHEDFFNNHDLYNKYLQVKENIVATNNNTLDRIERHDNIQKTQAVQKVDSESVDYRWNEISNKVKSIAIDKGLDISNADVIEQLQGIWYHQPTLSPAEIVDKYLSQQNEAKEIEEERNFSSALVEIVVKCFKAGISTTTSEIKSLLSSGKTPDDVIKYLSEKESEKKAEKAEEKQEENNK